MLSLSEVSRLEKNKLSSDGIWYVMLEVRLNDEDNTVLNFVRNNENVHWNGIEWMAFPFELGDNTETAKREIPKVQIKVSNIGKAVQRYIEMAKGGVGADVDLLTVNSNDLENLTPCQNYKFQVYGVSCDSKWITFELHAMNPFEKRFPIERALKNNCRFKFKEARCGYTGGEAVCNKTIVRCRELGNSPRFGGFRGIKNGGNYI